MLQEMKNAFNQVKKLIEKLDNSKWYVKMFIGSWVSLYISIFIWLFLGILILSSDSDSIFFKLLLSICNIYLLSIFIMYILFNFCKKQLILFKFLKVLTVPTFTVISSFGVCIYLYNFSINNFIVYNSQGKYAEYKIAPRVALTKHCYNENFNHVYLDFINEQKFLTKLQSEILWGTLKNNITFGILLDIFFDHYIHKYNNERTQNRDLISAEIYKFSEGEINKYRSYNLYYKDHYTQFKNMSNLFKKLKVIYINNIYLNKECTNNYNYTNYFYQVKNKPLDKCYLWGASNIVFYDYILSYLYILDKVYFKGLISDKDYILYRKEISEFLVKFIDNNIVIYNKNRKLLNNLINSIKQK